MFDTKGVNESELTVAIVGAGQAAVCHASAFAQLGPAVRIIGFADVDEHRAKKLATVYDACAFTDYRPLLETAPDIAVICLPHHLHREAALAAAAAGSHVLVEKPLAHTLEDAEAIVSGCHRSGVRLTVGFVHRYRMEFQHARQLIARGMIGTPAMAVDYFGLYAGSGVPDWVWQKRFGGGGILLYTGIHSIDWLRWLLDSEVDEVFGYTVSSNRHRADVEQGLVATLVFANGCLASLIQIQPGYLAPRVRATDIYGSEACIRICLKQYLEFSSDEGGYRIDVDRDEPFSAQAREFVAAIREDREPWITGEDGLRTLQVAMAIYRSARTGRSVSVSDR
jgi:predicted dehydrogenase